MPQKDVLKAFNTTDTFVQQDTKPFVFTGSGLDRKGNVTLIHSEFTILDSYEKLENH